MADKFLNPESNLNYGQMNDRIINFWKKNKIFEKSVDQRSEKDVYVFYDGPPFVTGLPHYGSLLPSIAKDLIPRYWTMKGKKVRRVWGWDCHGLPIENKVEAKLNLKSRRDVEKIGLKTFIEGCRSYVSQTSSEWNWYIDHVGRWVDIDNAYRTMDISFMESVLWVFKQIYDKGLIYKGKRVSLYCPRCGSPVSNFEIAMDNSYKEISEESTTYKFKLTLSSVEKIKSLSKNKIEADDKVFFLAWSTTPWNKIVTTALAINPEFTYILVKQNDEHYLLAETTKHILESKYDLITQIKGQDLLNLSYEPMYDIESVPEGKKAWIVIPGDFVTAEEGTGIVTMAVYGEDDFKAMTENNVWLWEHVDEEGIIRLDHPLFKDQYYLKANKLVDEDLANRNLIYRHDKLTHSVPLCWRCSTRLFYKPQDAWFLKVSQLKEKLIETNENIYWFPHHIKKGRFLKGIESAPDWCLSRSRYWATPMPIWECECGHRQVLGSISEIEKLSGKKVTDLHRPYIDEFTFPCPKCQKEMKRIPEVLDCWMESGSMPYGERHYPFENKENFERNFPADFICEYIAQTRAWFYVMHVVSNSLFSKNAFKNVICTGVIKGTDGRKMSKSYGNYPDPQKVLTNYGGDALRLYLMGSPVMSGKNLNVSEDDVADQNKRCLATLYNSYKYFITYANLHNFVPDKKYSSVLYSDLDTFPNILDKWLFARLKQLNYQTEKYLKKYDIPHAVRLIRPFIEDLSTWYIRQNRDRFVVGDLKALNSLYFVLMEFCKISAPTIPFIAEEIYQNLKQNNDPESVHLCLWPKYPKLTSSETELIFAIEEIRKICTLGNAIRKEKQIPTRQPLKSVKITLKNPIESLFKNDLETIILNELNVKEIRWHTNKKIETEIEYDENISQDLLDEGEARKIIRQIQQARKKAGTQRNQIISITLPSWPKAFESEIKQKTLVSEIKKGENLTIL